MATTTLMRPMTAIFFVGHHNLLLSFLFVVMMTISSSQYFMMTTSMSCQSVQAFSFHVRQHQQQSPSSYSCCYSTRSSSRSNFSVVYYTSSAAPFYDVQDETTSPNNNDQLWQLLQELRQGLNKNNNCKNNSKNNNDDSSSDKDEAFLRAIQSLYLESQFNIHHLENEIEALRQKWKEDSPIGYGGSNNGSYFSFQQSSLFQTIIQERNNSSNMDVDEIISNKVLKAVFVGYQWTEYDKKRLSSAHP